MNNELLKKLLNGIPQQEDQDSYPTPLVEDQSLPIDQEMNLRKVSPLDFTNEPADKIVPDPQPAKISPGLPFTKNQKDAITALKSSDIEDNTTSNDIVPETAKKPVSLAEMLAGVKTNGKNTELQDAQGNANDMISNLLMLKGVNTMAQSFVHQKPDENFLSDNISLANKNVSDIKERQKLELEQRQQGNKDKEQIIKDRSADIDEQKANLELGDLKAEADGNSDISKSLVAYLGDMGVNVPQGTPYSQIKKLIPEYVSKYQTDEKRDSNAEIANIHWGQQKLQREQMQNDKNTKLQNAADTKMNSMATQFKGSAAAKQAESDIYAAQKVEKLNSLFNNPSPQVANLLTAEVAKMAHGGAATAHGIEGLSIDTANSKVANMIQKFTNSPTPANAQAFIKQYVDYSRDLAKGGKEFLKDRSQKIYNTNKHMASPEGLAAFKENYIDSYDSQTTDTAKTPQKGEDAGFDAFLKANGHE